MKKIDHDPNEHVKFPDYGERKWARDKFGDNPSPSNLFYFLIPIIAFSVAMFLWRGY